MSKTMAKSQPYRQRSIFTFISYLFAFTLSNWQTNAGEPIVQDLYKQYYSGGTSSGLIVFERNIIYPAKRASSAPSSNVSSNNVQPVAEVVKTFFTFRWCESNFVLAVSTGIAITNESDLGMADKLYGFNGNDYWRLLSDVTRTYVNSGEGPDFLAPVDSASVLSIIPKNEILTSKGQYVPNSTFSTINDLVGECRRVVQFGFSFPLQGKPNIVSTNRLVVSGVDGQTQVVSIDGDLEHPDVLIYGDSTNVQTKFRVAVDYDRNILKIDRLSSSGKRPANTIVYTVLLAQNSLSNKIDNVYSYQKYEPNQGRVITELAKNGATVSAKLQNNGEVVPQKKVLKAAKPLPGRDTNKRPYILIAFVAVSVVFGLVVLVLIKKAK
jgi:hypothetical protein